MNVIFQDNTILKSKIKPTKVSVINDENGWYLDYTGVADTNKGKIKIRFPKIALEFDTVSSESEMWNGYVMKQSIYIENDSWCEYEFLERPMTKAEIERELGYKISIV
ncbi:hypothetical protein SDC9_46807 [bioreactor metagenome]|uniref:Uncharacterized protein n=1 Tax=bioreactor metagenome TaxID=1076179 RepID=A0A644W9W3_9ZZZZ